MSARSPLRGIVVDFLTAVQFLTRLPLPALPYDAGSLSRAVKFFPLVGLLPGASAAALLLLLEQHLSHLAAATGTVLFLTLMTGCFHEDALADAADAFGGGQTREQVLLILKDSRIGAYGGAALVLSLLARVTLLAALPAPEIARALIAAHVLCRWTTLPLSFFLPPAVASGQAARIAYLMTRGSLITGTILSFIIAMIALRTRALPAIAGAMLLTLLTGRFYKRRLGGVTGDCFGATNQLTEIFVYACGAWFL